MGMHKRRKFYIYSGKYPVWGVMCLTQGLKRRKCLLLPHIARLGTYLTIGVGLRGERFKIKGKGRVVEPTTFLKDNL